MKHIYENQTAQALRLLLVSSFLLLSGLIYAEGSRDLYPVGKQGNRAVLRSSTTVAVNYPFPNLGTHYVYAIAGERITMASSAQSETTTSAIRLYDTTGMMIINNSTASGQIPNRTAELAGPQLFNGSVAGRYTPIYHQVTVTGIYKVEFLARGTGDPSAVNPGDGAWSQGSDSGIVSWDVSVINQNNTGFIGGRVYTNVLNLSNGTATPNTVGFYGIIYVLTEDGFQYRVNNNGNNGLYFTFFVNNNGFVDPTTKNPLYKSLNTTAASDVSLRVNNPNSADSETQTTHKMFYNLPNTDLPLNSIGAVPGGSTWLRKLALPPTVSAVTVYGVEGIQGQVSNKGGYIRYAASAKANYRITIASGSIPATFVPRTLTGAGKFGENNVYWDGKGGDGVSVPAGSVPIKITAQLQGAEVHFPFFDMEYNTRGTIIELLDNQNPNLVVSDIVYWNDTDVRSVTATAAGSNPDPKNNSHLPPVNSAGIRSTVNGHQWGIGATGISGQFGDEKSIDTWTFVKGPESSIETAVVVKVADLKVSQLTVDRANLTPGESFTATVKVKNDGPDAVSSAPFSFSLPTGFTAGTATFINNGCGTQTTAISFDASTRKYNSVLALPNGCEVTYTFILTASTVLQPTIGFQNFRAAILRQNDFTDPDATNPDPAKPPTDPEYECANNGLGGICNNIRNVSLYYASTEPCTVESSSELFSVSGGNIANFTALDSNYAAQVDLFTLDNSFSLSVNGTPITTRELEFQSSDRMGINVQFADGTNYEANTPTIYSMEGNGTSPLVRVLINHNGVISFFGSKQSNGPLFPLTLINGNALNVINWNTGGSNTITISQIVYGPTTNATGRVSALNIGPCICYNPANTTSAGPETKVGITTLQRAGAQNGNWPMIRQSGHLALESNSKGFVMTRVTTEQLAGISDPQEGMMVYDTTAKCLKIYADRAWRCFSTVGCP